MSEKNAEAGGGFFSDSHV